MSTHSPLADAIEAEHELVSGLLNNPHVLARCEEALGGNTVFADLTSQNAWEAICEVDHSGAAVTPNAVIRGMVSLGVPVERARHYVIERQGAIIGTAGDVVRAAERVRDSSVVRAVAAQADRVREVCADPRTSAVDAMGALTSAVTSVSAASVTTADMLHRGDEAAIAAFEAITKRASGDLPGITTGSNDLDRVTGGLCEGQVIVIGGRPSIGKSVTVIDLGRAALRSGAGVIVFSMEMMPEEIMGRFIAAEAGIDAGRIRTGRLTDDDQARFFDAVQRFPFDNLYIVDKPMLTIGQATAITRQVHREFTRRGITKVVGFVDYLQIMGSERGSRRETSRQQFLGEVCVGFKGLAMELSMPFVVLSQLNRGAGKDRPPSMEDLRESGDIENNADVVILLHRPDFADPEDRPREIDYLMVKHRQAPAPQIVTRFHEFRYFRTHDMAHTSGPEDV